MGDPEIGVSHVSSPLHIVHNNYLCVCISERGAEPAEVAEEGGQGVG